MLAICETHPVQYHAPVYQELARLGMDFEVVYGSDFSVKGYQDREFQAEFAWDTDLLSGYRSRYLLTVANGGAANYENVTANGLAAVLKNLRPKAILGLGYKIAFDAGVIKAAKRLGVPLFLRTEATDVALKRSRFKSYVRDWTLRNLYRRCQRLLYVGENNRQHYIRLGVPENRLIFSPYCVSTRAFQCDLEVIRQKRDVTRAELGIEPAAYCILFCGKLSRRKGVDILVNAIKRFPDELRSRVHLILLGEGALRRELAESAMATPRVSVEITGFKNQTELSRYYHAADVAVLPSITSETWGLVVNEALHHGLPCIVSDSVGCAPDLIEPGITGDIFRSGDVDHLRDRLISSYSLIHREDIHDACQQKVNRYSVERAARGIREAIDALEAS